MKELMLSSLLLLPVELLAQSNPNDVYIAKQKAESDERIAKTYGVAIAIAGACIGGGIYLGIRNSRKDNK